MKTYGGIFLEQLPEPLTKEELTREFIKFKNGDEQARENIIISNIKLVISRVQRKFSNSKYDISEMISIGIIGLIKAVDTFDYTKGFCFSTYASRCIDNEILMFLRKNKLNVVSLEDTLSGQEGDNLTIEETLIDTETDIEREYIEKEELEDLRAALTKLDDKEKELFWLYYVENKRQIDISKMYGTTQPNTSRKIKCLINRIRKLM